MKIKIPENDKCEDLWIGVDKALKKLTDEIKIKYLRDDARGASRIVVFDNKVFDWGKEYRNWEKDPVMFPNVPYCYNLDRLEEFGICETEDQTYNFGFCSPSCLLHHISDLHKEKRYRKQWELKAKYHEDTDLLDEFIG